MLKYTLRVINEKCYIERLKRYEAVTRMIIQDTIVKRII